MILFITSLLKGESILINYHDQLDSEVVFYKLKGRSLTDFTSSSFPEFMDSKAIVTVPSVFTSLIYLIFTPNKAFIINLFYDRNERIAGESHYTFSKMFNLAINGITSFSTKPLRLITILGISIATVSILILIWTLVEFALGKTVKGWTSILSAISFLSGIQLLFLGVIGEYIGKIYMETKKKTEIYCS